MAIEPDRTRRGLLKDAALAGAGVLLLGGGRGISAVAQEAPGRPQPASDRAQHGAAQQGEAKQPETEIEVTPAEDLMREHGVLKRILLVYREAVRRLDERQDLPPEPLAEAAGIIRHFIEDYHEKLEEDHLFPRFRKAGRLVELVDVLTKQHQAGRRVTDVTMRLATTQAMRDADQRRQLTQSLQQFIRMYEPHEAREDTVLFPAIRSVVSANEFDSLGDEFEKKENQLFGENGFEKMVDKVAVIEKALGIYDLNLFTPRL